MNTTPNIVQLFGPTTTNVTRVEDFLEGIPRYLESGYAMDVSPYARRLLHRTDCFEFELRQYLAAQTKTRYHLNRSVRTFLALDDHSARVMIRFSLDAVQHTLLQNEWYELMPHFQRVRQHLQKTFAL